MRIEDCRVGMRVVYNAVRAGYREFNGTEYLIAGVINNDSIQIRHPVSGALRGVYPENIEPVDQALVKPEPFSKGVRIA